MSLNTAPGRGSTEHRTRSQNFKCSTRVCATCLKHPHENPPPLKTGPAREALPGVCTNPFQLSPKKRFLMRCPFYGTPSLPTETPNSLRNTFTIPRLKPKYRTPSSKDFL